MSQMVAANALAEGEGHLASIDQLGQLIDRALGESGDELLGPELGAITEPRSDDDGVRWSSMPRLALVKLALVGDCLRVADLAVSADGRVSDEEVDYVFPLAFLAARFLGRVRPDYRRFRKLAHDSVPEFLRYYQRDSGPFGKQSLETEWLGLRICRRVAREQRDPEILDLYERMATRLMDEVVTLGGTTPAERNAREELSRLLSTGGDGQPRAEEAAADARAAAFCDPAAPAVFTAVAQASSVWERDPLDVESVHGEARETFQRLVDRVTTPIQQTEGRTLLILGESGSGKTHLMRAFRNHLHERRLGYAAYLQMTTRAGDFSRYALLNLIDSLERPYDPPAVESSALMTLSDALAEWRGVIPRDELEALREGELPADSDDVIGPMVDRLLGEEGLRSFDPDLLRVFLHLQSRDPAVQARALKYLRCEHLGDYDRRKLGGIAPRTDQDAAQRTLEELARLVWSATDGSLVLLIDQLEDIVNVGAARERFPRLVDCVRHLVENVPSSIVVLACLDDFYSELKRHLTRSALDRLERDPDPVRLTSRRNLDEIEEIVSCRLQYLYDSAGVRPREDEPLFPFSHQRLHKLSNLRTRDVLDWCRRYRAQCVAEGQLVDEDEIEEEISRPAQSEQGLQVLTQAWNDFRVEYAHDPPEEESDLLDLLDEAAGAVAEELGLERKLARERQGETLTVTLPREGSDPEPLIVSVCNKTTRGGALARQIEAVEERAAGRRVGIVRSSQYPRNPKTKIFQKLGELLGRGGRRVVMEDSDWRTLMAAGSFRRQQEGDPALAGWLRREQPLSSLRPLRELFDLDRLRAEVETKEAKRTAVGPKPAPAPRPRPVARSGSAPRSKPTGAPAAAPQRTAATEVVLGRRAGVGAGPVTFDPTRLSRHAGFLGSTGSGKTTIALHVIESLLERGIPALLVDRKGDLAGYADPAFWRQPPEDDARAEQKRRMADRIDVHLYTPGDPNGRPLALPVIPPALAELPSHERNKTARHAASALAAMMSYRDGANDRARSAILAKAIEVLGELDPAAATLEGLVDMIDRQDPVLVNSVGRLDGKHYPKLVEHLETLRLHRGELLTGDGELLDPAELFGLGERRGDRTRLTIVNTKFLGDNAAIEFWVARLLLELSRWASKHPSDGLQAVVLFDEADLYLPAQSKPATKEPMQDLLKRSRSAGLGLFLSTQNPGDLDYKSRDNINTWFLGRIGEPRSIGKMKPLLSELRVDVSSRLARQRPGEFFLVSDGQVTELRARRSLLRTSQFAEDEILKLASKADGSGL